LRAAYGGRDIDVLLADLTGRSVAWVVAHGETEVDETRIEPLMERRIAGEPLQYIRQRSEFYGRDFFVDDRVLIPRPETELLVEAAIELAPRGARLVDVGTGSGAIAVTLSRERPDLSVVAIDLSIGALAVARRNGAPRLVASDVFEGLRARFDVIVSNPPYIPEHDVAALMTEVRDHEPRVALTPGALGTEVIERLLEAPLVILEIGYGQERDVRAVAADRGFEVREVRPDLAGIPRVVVLSRHGQ
jgi:release factor glutamine methyltransferase